MHRGYVKIYRKSIEHALFNKPLIWHFWQYCLLIANHKDREIYFNGKPFMVKRGSFIMSRKTAALATGLSEQNIRTSIKTLLLFKMIEKSTSKLTKQATILTICKYSEYQKKSEVTNQVTNQAPTKHQPSTNQGLTTNNNVKNYKKVKNDKNKYLETSDEFQVADFLYQNILKFKSDFKQPNLQKWAGDARKMLKVDGRCLETIKKVIKWVCNDDFEQSNVLSIAKLRKRFDSLEIKMNTKKPTGQSAKKDDRSFMEIFKASTYHEDGSITIADE